MSLKPFALERTNEAAFWLFVHVKQQYELFDLHLIKDIYEFSLFDKDEHTLPKMARVGNDAVLKFLLSNFTYSNFEMENAALVAAEANFPLCVDIICPNKTNVFKRKLLFAAIRGDSFFSFSCIFNSMTREDPVIYARQAVRGEALKVLKFLLQFRRVHFQDMREYARQIQSHKVLRFFEYVARHYQ